MDDAPKAWFSHADNWLLLGSRPIAWQGWVFHFVLFCLVLSVGNHYPGPLRYPLVGLILACSYVLCVLKMDGGPPWARQRR